MKPFDYELYKHGKKVFTRDGREVRQLIMFDVDASKCPNPLAAVVDGHIVTFYPDGKSVNDGSLDLFIAIENVEVWANVYVYEYLDGEKNFLAVGGYANERDARVDVQIFLRKERELSEAQVSHVNTILIHTYEK